VSRGQATVDSIFLAVQPSVVLVVGCKEAEVYKCYDDRFGKYLGTRGSDSDRRRDIYPPSKGEQVARGDVKHIKRDWSDAKYHGDNRGEDYCNLGPRDYDYSPGTSSGFAWSFTVNLMFYFLIYPYAMHTTNHLRIRKESL